MIGLFKNIDFNKDWVVTSGFIVGIIFFISMGMYKIGGNRPDNFMRTVTGQVEEVYLSSYRVMGGRHSSGSTIRCMIVKLKDDKRKYVNDRPGYKKLFYKGQNVRLLTYKANRQRKFKECWEGDKLLVDNNNLKGIIVFVTMLISGVYFLFIFYIRFFVQKR